MSVLRPGYDGPTTRFSRWGPRQPGVGAELPTSNAEAVVGRTDCCNPSRRLRAHKRVSQRGLPCFQTAGEYRRCPPQRQQTRVKNSRHRRQATCRSAGARERVRKARSGPAAPKTQVNFPPLNLRAPGVQPSAHFPSRGRDSRGETRPKPIPDHAGRITSEKPARARRWGAEPRRRTIVTRPHGKVREI